MARPTKQGIDYFPIDCQFDDKIEMYLIEKGAIGLGVLVSLWQMIYSNEGYYIANNKDLHLLIKKRVDVDVNEVSDCINICLERNLFNHDLHQKYGILTSKAIQKRFFDAAKKKKSVSVVVDYVINSIDSSGNWVYVDGNATNVNIKEDVDVDVKEEVKEEVDNSFELATKKPKKKTTPKTPGKTVAIWEQYSTAYFNRYGVEPVRNATVNGQLSKFADRVSQEEAPHIAAFYVQHNNSFYAAKLHPVGMLLADAEKLRTEWATNQTMTNTRARQLDEKQSNHDLVAECKRLDKLEGKVR